MFRKIIARLRPGVWQSRLDISPSNINQEENEITEKNASTPESEKKEMT
jgi:hypothetical protein